MNKKEGSIRIDARMIENSGIGVVIRNIISRMIENHPAYKFQILLQNESQSNYPWLNSENTDVAIWSSRIYSIREHISPIPSNFVADVTWVPHYNVSAQFKGNVVATIHDLLHIENAIIKRSLIQRFYAKSMFHWVKHRCCGLGFVSKTTQEVFHEKIGKPKQEIVILNGVDPIWFQSRGVNDVPFVKKPYVVFVGNGFPHKNLVRLISAMKLVRQTSDLNLVIVGNFDGLRLVDQEAIDSAEKNADFVTLTGKVSFSNLLAIISNATALVSPSLYEGFGLPPLEALATGIPVVVSNIPVYQELFKGIAHFVDPYSPESICTGIQSAIIDETDPEIRRAFSRSFNWDNAEAQIFNFLTSFPNNDSKK